MRKASPASRSKYSQPARGEVRHTTALPDRNCSRALRSPPRVNPAQVLGLVSGFKIAHLHPCGGRCHSIRATLAAYSPCRTAPMVQLLGNVDLEKGGWRERDHTSSRKCRSTRRIRNSRAEAKLCCSQSPQSRILCAEYACGIIFPNPGMDQPLSLGDEVPPLFAALALTQSVGVR